MVGGRYAEAIRQADVVLRVISDAVVVHDVEGNLAYANQAAAKMCGFDDVPEMLATPPLEIVHRFELLDELGRDVDPMELPGRRALLGEEPEPLLLSVRLLSTGARWWSLVRASALRNEAGEAELAIVIWHDVTKEQRYKESERMLSAVATRLVSSFGDEQVLASVAECIVPTLGAWCAIELVENGILTRLAVARAGAPSEDGKEPAPRSQDSRGRAVVDLDDSGPVAKALRTGVAELTSEIDDAALIDIVPDPDLVRGLPAPCASRSVMIVPIPVGTKTDGIITLVAGGAVRRHDARDLDVARELARRIGIAIEKVRAYRAAREAIRARDTFLAVTGHELRTPLAALVLQIDSLRHAMASGRVITDPARCTTLLERSAAHADRLSRLIDELLDVSRITSGRLALHRERCDVAALVRDVAERFSGEATRAGSLLTVTTTPGCEGLWDAHRIDQVISNLLSNALKYGRGAPIDIGCDRVETGVALSVVDRGIGISALDQARIFDRFERAVSERSYGGLGIGLWITREIVRAHGGAIRVASAAGQGSTFTVELPLA